MSIAIVEDDGRVRESLQFLFSAAGIEVACFDSPGSFLQSDYGDFHCIISDVKMPGMSGYEFQRELVRRGTRVPFIFISAYPNPDSMDEAVSLGAVAFLSKPLDGEELLQLVQQQQ